MKLDDLLSKIQPKQTPQVPGSISSFTFTPMGTAASTWLTRMEPWPENSRSTIRGKHSAFLKRSGIVP